MPPGIRGYYYDPEKKKYFKILPNHAAPPGSSYSHENVRKARREAQVLHGVDSLSLIAGLTNSQKERERKKAQRQPRTRLVQRSKLLQNPVGSLMGLAREHGCQPRREQAEVSAATYVKAFKRRLLLKSSDPAERFTAIAFDPSTQGLVGGTSSSVRYDLIQAVPRDAFPLLSEDEEDKWKDQAYKTISEFITASEITSIKLSSLRTLVFTLQGGAFPPKALITPLCSPDTVEAYGHLDNGSIEDYVLKKTSTLYCSAICPSGRRVAIGSDRGVILMSQDSVGGSVQTLRNSDWKPRPFNTISDVLATEFLDNHTIAAGQRDGYIQLMDVRMDGRGGRVLRVKHPSSVTHVRQVDASKIIACGLQSSLNMYDLRFPELPAWKKRAMQPTQAVLEYDHFNDFRTDLGFDIDVELGLVAAGRDDNTVRLYSLHTAKVLRSNASMPLKERPRCIAFAAMKMDHKPSSLLVGASDEVLEFSW
ncbi:MAG: hypothetical protein M1833_003299 [Piccolia ochrophora]|nr:MAG: hypothetical protein M1833_003299 [Piccolia ochrophora]